MNDALKRYIQRDWRKVEGYFDQPALDAVAALAEAQRRAGMAGPICEIGVHHGRSFILLHLLTVPGEQSVAYDLFENQDGNTDQSGLGDKAAFVRNLKACGCDLGRIRIVSRNSLDLTPEAVLADAQGRVRIFSIDGGHSRETVRNDLALADKTIGAGGLIVVDDFFDESWPGVAEGVCGYLSGADSRLIPIAVFDGKMIFTNDEAWAETYLKTLAGLSPRYIVKQTAFFGTPVAVLQTSRKGYADVFRRSDLWQSLKDTKTGAMIRKLLA